MERHRRQVRFAIGFGVAGVLVTVLGLGGGLPPGPTLQVLVVLAAAGLTAGATLGWVVASLPQRATFPLGNGTLLAALGAVGVPVFLGAVLGQDLIDDPDGLLAASLIAAGIGWTIGAAAGAALAAGGEPFSVGQAWLLRVMALAAIPVALTPLWIPTMSGRAAGAVARSTGPIRGPLLADAAIVCITLLLVAGGRHARSHDRAPRRIGSRLSRGAAATGVALGALVIVGLLRTAIVTPAFAEEQRRAGANRRTGESLIGAAQRFMDRDGSYPADLPALLTAGGRIQPGSVVTLLHAEEDRLCLRVGTDMGTGEATEPFWSAVIRPRSETSGSGAVLGPSCDPG